MHAAAPAGSTATAGQGPLAPSAQMQATHTTSAVAVHAARTPAAQASGEEQGLHTAAPRALNAPPAHAVHPAPEVAPGRVA